MELNEKDLAGMDTESLDEIIHEIKSEEAAEINNSGREVQVAYVMGGKDFPGAGAKMTTEDLDEAIYEMKNEEAARINNSGRESQIAYIMSDKPFEPETSQKSEGKKFFDVTIQRVEYRSHTFRVLAKDRDEAGDLAVEESYFWDFHANSVKSADEVVTGIVEVRPPEGQRCDAAEQKPNPKRRRTVAPGM